MSGAPQYGGEADQSTSGIDGAALGSAAFREEFGIRYAYLAGAMYKGISSQSLVVSMGRAGLMAYFGSGGLDLDEIESAIRGIQSHLGASQAYGLNLLPSWGIKDLEDRTVDLYLKYRVRDVEAAAYMQITPALVRYRLSGVSLAPNGRVVVPNRVLAKVSRPEVAAVFLQPPPRRIVAHLLETQRITPMAAQLADRIPMSNHLCVEADSGGHTDGGVAFALMPAMQALRAEIQSKHAYETPVHLGAAGGIGTPGAAAAAFALGADFILTGSINQCTVEAGNSDEVKDLLQEMNIHDTAYAPAGDMFETGAKVQVLKRGSLFAARANKLYALYQHHASLADIDPQTRAQLEENWFRRPFDEVWSETRAHYARTNPARLAQIEANEKQKLAAIFRWYFIHTARAARRGCRRDDSDYQVHCGPALGAFNQWVKGTPLQSWRNRHVAELPDLMMRGAASRLREWFADLLGGSVRASRASLA